jgi:hypothetical protein
MTVFGLVARGGLATKEEEVGWVPGLEAAKAVGGMAESEWSLAGRVVEPELIARLFDFLPASFLNPLEPKKGLLSQINNLLAAGRLSLLTE